MSIRRLLLLAGVLLDAVALFAQGPRFDVYPTVLYPGDNVITIRCAAGIDEIMVVNTPNVTVRGDGKLSCPRTHDLRARLGVAHEYAELRLTVIDCRGQRFDAILPINNTWQLDHQLGVIELGTTRCIEFTIRSDATVTLDSVSSPGRGFSLRFRTSLPYTIRGGRIYRYEVCYDATRLGEFIFPVVTWIRRDQPNGGLASYPVADTGFVRVIPPRVDEPDPPEEPLPPEEPITDPTTFRSIAVPNAIVPGKGRFVVGLYDFVGLMAGYSITDEIMLLGGGAIPLPDDWGGVRGTMSGAIGIGGKAGIELADRLNVAVGIHWATSIYDEEITRDAVESRISLVAPWGAISYGTDDSRISLTGGYAFKHHVKPEIEFDEEAGIVALGGDYRLGNHWKVAAEVAWMQTVNAIPLLVTGRYFGRSYAIDLGVAFFGGTKWYTVGDEPAEPFTALPVLAAVFVF